MLRNCLINVYINKQCSMREGERVIFYAQLLEPNVKSITHWETDSPKTVFTINMTAYYFDNIYDNERHLVMCCYWFG